MEIETSQRIDEFLELLAEWVVELFHIEGRPMEFGQDGGTDEVEKEATDNANDR